MNPTIPLAIVTFLLGVMSAATLTYRQRLRASVRLLTTRDHVSAEDQALAAWTRDTKITVNTVTGTWISMTLRELAASSVQHRIWNVPTSVEIHPRTMEVDKDRARQHRG